MPDSKPRIPDSEARALWQRAIELQMAAEQGGTNPRLTGSGTDGYSLEQIVEAAQGAGVDRDYIRIALAERRLPDADQVRQDRWTARWQRFLLGSREAIEVSRLIKASPERVMAAFESIIEKPAFRMIAEDRVGPDPPLAGVLVYRIDRSSSSASSFHNAMTVADTRVAFVTATMEGERTLLRLRLPLFEHGTNLALTGGLAGGLGTAGGFGGASAGSALAGMIGTASVAAVAGPAAIGAMAAGALGVAGCRRIHHWGVRKGTREVRRLLQAVALEAESTSDDLSS